MPPQDPRPDLGDRFIKGPTLVVLGLAMHAGLVLITMIGKRPTDIWMAIGIGAALAAYSFLATVIVLMGLQSITGPNSWLARRMRSAKRILWAFLASLSVLVVAVLLFL